MISAIKLSKQLNEEFSRIYNLRLREIIEENNRIQKEKVNNPESDAIKDDKDSKKVISDLIATIQDDVSEFQSLLEYVSSIIRINSISPQVFSP